MALRLAAAPLNTGAKLVDENGIIMPEWRSFLTSLWLRSGSGPGIDTAVLFAQVQDLVPNPAPPDVLALTGSPWAYTAPYRGALVISGGGVVRLTLTRAAVVVLVGQPYAATPLLHGDLATLRYVGSPLVTFVAF
jgi:hypothetical protein